MIALPTTRCSILRGTTTNAYGDEVDADTVVASGVPLAVTPVGQASTDSADARSQEVETSAGRMPAGTDVRVGDRLRDDRDTSVVYLVTGSHQAPNPIMAQDVSVALTRTPVT